MSKTTGAENFRWDLSSIYSGIDDPQIDKDISLVVKMAENFNVSYKGKLSEKLGSAISDLIEITTLSDKISVYLYLVQSLNILDDAVNAKTVEADLELSKVFGQYMAFFDIELDALDQKTIENLCATESIVKKHQPWIDYKRVFKKHLLSEPVESALAKRGPFGAGSWCDFFAEFEAGLEFEFGGEKKNLTEMTHLLTDLKDVNKRSQILKIINEGLGGHFAKYCAQALYITVGATHIEKEERSFNSPMSHRNIANRVSDEVVNILHDAVRDVAGPLARRYYRLKAAHLGLNKLKWSDRNAPMPFSDDTVIQFDEALKMVLSSYRSFSPKMAELVQKIIEGKYIDAPAGKGRRNGAFNFSVVFPGGKPAAFTFLDYLGSNKDVKTLAHELGHGIHGLLAGEAQGVLMFRPPISYCETASVFGEITTFNFLKDQLIQKGNKKALLAFLMSSIDDSINTIVRQIGFSNFERRIHGMDSSYQKWEKPKKLSAKELGGLWLQTIKEHYGEEGDVFTYENAENLWTYIWHFYKPFYTYGYSFGQLLSQGLYAQRDRIGNQFEEMYLDMLRSGSTKDAAELVSPFDINLADKKFWIDGINNGLGKMIEEAEELSKEMGIKI